MSPDEIFAAQMWAWPDPVIKRDPAGRILIVNATFLQLYGGRVESWTGQQIQGWPTPNPQGLPNRFETRAVEGEFEIVYDWLEVTMADGNALAIARDVTCFQAPLIQQPVPEVTPQTFEPTGHAPVASPDTTPQTDPIHAAAPQPEANITAPSPTPTIEAPPVSAAPMQAQATVEPATVAAPMPTPVPSVIEAPQAEIATPEPELTVPEVTTPELSVPEIAVPETSSEPEPADQTASAENREFERRALPIEDGDAVLGTNWRDAVIAKAVGADQPEEDTTEEETPLVNDTAETAETGNTGDGLHILLAEDNAINALLTRTLLEAEGCIVETVEDGALAVQAVEKNDYDLIFMDMRMPNMDGLEATRKIRAMGARTEKLPIIALTANAFDDDRNACFDSGMNDFMTKPVSAEELTEMVQNWAGDKARQDEAA